MDETRAPVLDPGAKTRPDALPGALATDDADLGAARLTSVVFTYTPVGADSMPSRYCGALVASADQRLCRIQPPDCARIASAPASSLPCAGPMPRRKLIEITRTGPAPIAEEGTALIRDLYAMRPISWKHCRLAATEPLCPDLHPHRRLAGSTAPRQPRHHWASAGLPPPNTVVTSALPDRWPHRDRQHCRTRTIRPIALNRKTPLLRRPRRRCRKLGRHRLADRDLQNERASDPHAWLSATLTAIVKGHKQSQIDRLLPWNWTVTV